MDEFISIDKLIKAAKSKGINFGSGDPYNRLRYYTKIGWLPHMVRKIDKKGSIKGHYPIWTVDRLVLIETLKSQGYTNDQISEKLTAKNKVQDFINVLKSPEVVRQVVLYTILLIVVIIFSNELGILHLGKEKILPTSSNPIEQNIQIVQNGTAFVPKNQNRIFVMSNNVNITSKVYVTFTEDYSPATRYWVSQIQDGNGFILELDAPTSNNAEFNWWLTQ